MSFTIDMPFQNIAPIRAYINWTQIYLFAGPNDLIKRNNGPTGWMQLDTARNNNFNLAQKPYFC